MVCLSELHNLRSKEKIYTLSVHLCPYVSFLHVKKSHTFLPGGAGGTANVEKRVERGVNRNTLVYNVHVAGCGGSS